MFKKIFVRVLAVGLALTAVFAIFAFSFRLFDRDKTEDDPKEFVSTDSEVVESESEESESDTESQEIESDTEAEKNDQIQVVPTLGEGSPQDTIDFRDFIS